MSSKSVQLRNAIVEVLNDAANDFVFNFSAEPAAAPLAMQELEELSDLRILVFAGAKKAERVSRGRFKRTYKPVIAIHRKLNLPTTEASRAIADNLIELEEQISTRLENEDFVLDDDTKLAFMAFDDEQDAELYNAEAMLTAGLYLHAMVLEYTTG